jgi:hypothetical protein
MATSIFFRTKVRASAAPIFPEPIMAYFVNKSPGILRFRYEATSARSKDLKNTQILDSL